MTDSDMIAKAARVATYAHRNQYRKYEDAFGVLPPYITHPARVASSVYIYQDLLRYRQYDRLTDLVAAAWLHDVVEDTNIDIFSLEQMFPESITRIVKGMTKQFAYLEARPELSATDTLISKLEFGGVRKERKSVELEYLDKQSPSVKLLKALDRLDNLSDIVRADPSFARVYAEESKALLEVLRTHIPRELEQAIEKILDKTSPRAIVPKDSGFSDVISGVI